MTNSFKIDDIAKIGVVRDTSAYQLPPEAWTTALNMRVSSNGLASIGGYEQIFGTPGVAPHFAMPVLSPSQVFWLYTSLTKAYVYDGATHTDITRLAGDYTGSNTRDWNGTLLAGVPILNNGTDAPQFWSALSTGTKLANLTNWPASTTALVLRSFGAFLVALHVTKSSTVYQHLVKWSDETQTPGSVPGSWDETDATTASGEYDLPDVNSGAIRDALKLGSKLLIYKDESTWVMQYIGGRAVFSFDTLLETSGILAPRCATITGDGKRHVVVTQNDIIIIPGTGDPQSVVHDKLRKEIFSNIDPTNYVNSFMWTDVANDEVVFAYPENGQTYPSRGLVFNYRTGAVTERDDIPGYRNVASGPIDATDTETWASTTGLWDSDTVPWSQQARRKLVACGTGSTKFFQLNSGTTRDGTAFTSTLARNSLAVIGKKRNGDPIVNFQVMKFVSRLWPKIQGAPIQIRLGFQETVEGVVSWTPYVDFDCATDMYADLVGSGRAVCVEFYCPNGSSWKIDGYSLDIVADGEF